MTTLNEALLEAAKYCQKKKPEEGCGLLFKDGEHFFFTPYPNISVNDKNISFAISPEVLRDAYKTNKLYAVVHSHCFYTGFSPTDVAFQKKMGIPWVLIDFTNPPYNIKWLQFEKEELPLYGRDFLFGVYDCYTFVKDWYEQELSILLSDYQRVDNFAKKGMEPYLENFAKEGFYEVALADIQHGDVLLFKLDDNEASHAAVYVGNNLIAHHLVGRVSKKDVFGKFYKDRLVKVIRHSSRK